MSKDRLKEHFSAYYDGSLDAGLRQSFSSKLASDPEFKAEYDQFARTMAMLAELGNEQIESPSFLSDRIANRLEAVPQRQSSPLDFITGNWFKTLGFGSLAFVAIAASIFAFNQVAAPGDVAESNLIFKPKGLKEKKDPDYLKIRIANGEARAFYRSSAAKSLVISYAKDGSVLKNFQLDKQDVDCALTNHNDETAVFQIEVSGETPSTYVFVAGKTLSDPTSANGNGPWSDFIEQVCNKYGVTVQLTVANPKANLSWKFESQNALDELRAAAKMNGWNVRQMNDGLIVIQDR